MFPPSAAAALNDLGHDAASVPDLGLAGPADDMVFDRAVFAQRIVVTENFADFAALVWLRMTDGGVVPVVFVRRDDLPRRGALATHLARRIDRWAAANPEPAAGLHWA